MKLIQCVDLVAKAAKKSQGKFTQDLFPAKIINPLRDFLQADFEMTILFSVIMILNFKSESVEINKISEYLHCSNLQVTSYLQVLQKLEADKLIFHEHKRYYQKKHFTLHDIGYYISNNVLNAILSEDRGILQPIEKLEMIPFLEKVNQLYEDRERQSLTYQEMLNEVQRFCDFNRDLGYIKLLKRQQLAEEEELIFMHVCYETINGNEEVNLSHACEMIFDDATKRFKARRGLVNGTWDLIKRDLVKLKDGIFRSDRDILLTDNALDIFFPDEKEILSLKEVKNDVNIHCDDIKKIKLYYNQHENKQIEELSNLLLPGNFEKVIKRLGEKQMPPGFSILFYGKPGTGKTETALQLARKTGRDILQVDISDTRSMWFGESEKKIKAVFTRYRKLLKHGNTEPVLLFNECDAVFSKRRAVGGSCVDQTENAIQNIILQELETLNGILIATTNLTMNLDRAFDRRFLYKIEFLEPDVQTRALIWKDKFRTLSRAEAYSLAAAYKFTGGEIANINRKANIMNILDGRAIDFDSLRLLCEEEKGGMLVHGSIGF